MKSSSLRLRVTLAVIVVLTVILVALMVAIDTLFGVEIARDQAKIINDRVQVARQLEKQHLTPLELLARLTTGGFVQIHITDSSGVAVGQSMDHAATTPTPRDVTYSNGTVITLFFSAQSRPQIKLRELLVITGLGALVVTVLALVFTVRFALSPLETMARLARSITDGHRGHRLSPHRTDTELGRTAAAFDDMLDALEGAEEHARASEARTRQFVADAAHELRTPIAGIQAVAESVLQQDPQTASDERERMLLLLVREARRAGRLVDDLLSLARVEAGLDLHHQPVNLRALVAAEADRARMLYPALSIEVEGPEVTVQGDAQRLTQVLANLINNAQQATGGTGQVTVRVQTREGFAKLTVSDNGPGVPEGDRERIFDRLVRLDQARTRRSGGSGLGLAIARGICRMHGGDLHCGAPDPGHTGAVFHLSLPLPVPSE